MSAGEQEHAGRGTDPADLPGAGAAPDRLEIDDDKVGPLREGGLQAQRAVGLRTEAVPATREGAGDVPGEREFVFDDEDAHGGR